MAEWIKAKLDKEEMWIGKYRCIGCSQTIIDFRIKESESCICDECIEKYNLNRNRRSKYE